jgi:hypothetical protein
MAPLQGLLHIHGAAVEHHRAQHRLCTRRAQALGRCRHQGHEVRTGRMPHEHEAPRIAPPCGSLLLRLGQRLGHVTGLNVRLGVGQHAVIDRHQHDALPQPVRHLVLHQPALGLVTLLPATAVHQQQHRGALRLRGQVHVHALPRVVAIGHVVQQARARRQRQAVMQGASPGGERQHGQHAGSQHRAAPGRAPRQGRGMAGHETAPWFNRLRHCANPP